MQNYEIHSSQVILGNYYVSLIVAIFFFFPLSHSLLWCFDLREWYAHDKSDCVHARFVYAVWYMWAVASKHKPNQHRKFNNFGLNGRYCDVIPLFTSFIITTTIRRLWIRFILASHTNYLKRYFWWFPFIFNNKEELFKFYLVWVYGRWNEFNMSSEHEFMQSYVGGKCCFEKLKFSP